MLESAYQECLKCELKRSNLDVQLEVPMSLSYYHVKRMGSSQRSEVSECSEIRENDLGWIREEYGEGLRGSERIIF
ncbi:GxxExxY protein [Methanocella arvoryzae]|uniref:GxxExxY protein n=1 Tax=Methanocella arvoryzae TaxID=1175445 RepID=UPI00064E8B02|nr:GxxExxY protein [Methanocella arvoryzae]